jgi:hypothetical protein
MYSLLVPFNFLTLPSLSHYLHSTLSLCPFRLLLLSHSLLTLLLLLSLLSLPPLPQSACGSSQEGNNAAGGLVVRGPGRR